MRCPTPCICGEIVELDSMYRIEGELPDGGNLVCKDCFCDSCEGTGQCQQCGGSGACDHCGATCRECEDGKCPDCLGLGYVQRKGSDE